MRVAGVAGVALHAAALLAAALRAAAALGLVAWLFYFGTLKYTQDEPWRVFPPDYGCDKLRLLDRCTLNELLFMWALPAVLALSSFALLLLRARLGAHDSQRSGPLGRLGQRLLPPRRFWLWWCGGLSLADGLAVAFWAAFNAAWGVAVLTRFWKLIPFFSRISPHTAALELQLLAVACGVLLLPNFVLLFLPVTRGSAVLQAAGLSYPDAIRYHRWLGHAVMVLVTLHSLGFWGIWLYQGVWLKEALDQGPVFNNLAGGASFLGGLALWLSSLEVARRASYEAFYKLHHAGFWVFMLAGCAHYSDMFWYFLPGLVLYGVDGVYRIAQGLGVCSGPGAVRVLHAAASPGGTTCSLLLEAPAYAVANTGFVWLCVPDITWHSWHPFEYFAVPAPRSDAAVTGGPATASGTSGTSGATAMLLHVKAYDRWTAALVSLVAARGTGFAVRIEGPYAELPGPVLGHPEAGGGSSSRSGGGKDTASAGQAASLPDGLVIAAGGVGATAAMSVLQDLAVEGAAVAGLPTLLVWACRKADELEFLAPRLLAMASALKLDLTLRFYCTGDPGATSGAALAAAAHGKAGAAGAAGASPSASGAGGCAGAAAGGGGLVTSSLCPVVALPYFWCQAGHKGLLHVLAFAGALGGLLLVRWLADVRPALAGREAWPTGARGSALVCVIAGCILLPGWLALAAALAARRGACVLRGCRGGGAAAAASGISKAELGRHLLSHRVSDGGLSSPDVTPRAADADAAAAGGHLATAAAAAAGDPAARAAVAALAAGTAARVQPAAGGGWELHVPLPAAAAPEAAAAALAVTLEAGRPPLRALVAPFLARVAQLPSGGAAAAAADPAPRQVRVYGMGPSPLVEDVKLLCDEMNSSSGSGGSSVWLGFVQKTHEL